MSRKRARKFSVQPAKPPNSEINVTPLVDVVLVLLIIFMVVTPLLEKDIEVRVPQSEQVDDTTEVPPDQLLVTLDPAGVISVNYEVVPPAEYVDRLKAKLDKKAKSDRLVFFAADDKTNYARLITALDGARKAGAETLGMMTDKLELPTGPVAPAPPGDAPAPPDAPAP